MWTRIPIRSDDDFHEEEVEVITPDEGEDTEDAPGSCEESARTWKHRCLCMKADFENYKRNAESERDRLTELGKQAVLAELFPIAEHLERALTAAREHKGNDGIIAGLELVQKDMEKMFERYGIERIPTLGQCFDPNLHEAVAAIDAEGVSEGTIVEELHPGFKRNGKLLCPAKVVVAK
jgi:molecular chaperone GrpE